MLAWAAVIAAVLLLPALRRLERKRERPTVSGAFAPSVQHVAGKA
jgi:hypothetical protein